MQFVVSLLTPVGATSVSRTTPHSALNLARQLADQGEVVITTPSGNILDPSEFAVVWGLS